MKKLLGISLVALFAATPLFANAADDDRKVTVINATAPSEASSTLATTTYVQGAYVAAADKIDALIEDTAAVNGEYVKAGKTVSANLNALDGHVKTNTANIATMSGDIATMSGNIETMSGDIATMSDNLETLMGDADVPGSIKQQIASVDAGALSNDISANKDAIDGIKAKEIKYMDTWNSISPKSVKIEDLK